MRLQKLSSRKGPTESQQKKKADKKTSTCAACLLFGQACGNSKGEFIVTL